MIPKTITISRRVNPGAFAPSVRSAPIHDLLALMFHRIPAGG